MFTGLVEEIGCVAVVDSFEDHFNLTIKAETVLADVKLGDSIAINGVCLTVTKFDRSTFTVGLAPETLIRTNLGALNSGDTVNLERALLPTTRMGGHYVQGHIDATGSILSFRSDADALWLAIKTSPALMRYIVAKGYITIDGASLTVVETGDDWFNVTLIDYTQQKISLPTKKIGDRVNLEVDILAKYVERLISEPAGDSLNSKFLQNHGFIKEGVHR